MVKKVKGLRGIVLIGTAGLVVLVNSGCGIVATAAGNIIGQGVGTLVGTIAGEEVRKGIKTDSSKQSNESYIPITSYEDNYKDTCWENHN